MKLKTVIGQNLYGAGALFLCAALLLCSLSDYFVRCRRLRGDVLRLHITANSDSAADQAVKLLVRDAVLEAGAEIFNGSVTAAGAEEKLLPALGLLEKTAREVLRAQGFSYGARAYLCEDWFAARAYGDLTLPAGRYKALRIALGTGAGQNWWCVMFPPLCLPAAEPAAGDADAWAVFGEDGGEIVQAEGGYKIKFRIVELAETVWRKLTGS